MKCEHCKAITNLMVNGYSHKKENKRYICRECNTKRTKLYRNTPNGKKVIYAVITKYNKNNPERKKAWEKVNNSKFILSTKIPCYCGELKVDAHHPNPLEKEKILWLCRLHHIGMHKDINYLKNYYLGREMI